MRTILAALTLAAAFTSASAHAACTPLGGGTSPGCVPPDRTTARCEVKFGDEVVRFLDRVMDCRVSWAARPNVFDEDECLQAARDTYDGRMAKLLLKNGCPACLGPSVVPAGDAMALFAALNNGEVFCEGTLPFGSAGDSGYQPPTGIAYTCERYLSLSAQSLARAITRCHSRGATYAVTGRSFDRDACDAKALARFNDERASFLQDHPHCPPCVGTSLIGLSLSIFPPLIVDTTAYCAQTN